MLSTAVNATLSSLSFMTGAATVYTKTAAEIHAEEEDEAAAAFSDSDDEAGVNYHDKNQESNVCELLVIEVPPMSNDRLEEVVQLLEESLSKVLEVVEDAPPYVELYLENVKMMDKLLQGFDKVLRNSHKFGGLSTFGLGGTALNTVQLKLMDEFNCC